MKEETNELHRPSQRAGVRKQWGSREFGYFPETVGKSAGWEQSESEERDRQELSWTNHGFWTNLRSLDFILSDIQSHWRIVSGRKYMIGFVILRAYSDFWKELMEAWKPVSKLTVGLTRQEAQSRWTQQWSGVMRSGWILHRPPRACRQMGCCLCRCFLLSQWNGITIDYDWDGREGLGKSMGSELRWTEVLDGRTHVWAGV